jgi:hypothetical protein
MKFVIGLLNQIFSGNWFFDFYRHKLSLSTWSSIKLYQFFLKRFSVQKSIHYTNIGVKIEYPRSRVLPEKLIVTQLVKKVAGFCGTRSFIIVFTITHHRTLFGNGWTQSKSSYPFYKNRFNVILPFTSKSSKWSIPFWCSEWNSVFIFYLPSVLHSSPVSIPMISSSSWDLVKRTHREAPQYAVCFLHVTSRLLIFEIFFT